MNNDLITKLLDVSSSDISDLLRKAEEGDSEAQFKLGDMFSRSGQGYQAAKYYVDAANNGHPQAQYMVGCLYEDGTFLGKKYKEASLWYYRAALQGVEGAINGIKRCSTVLEDKVQKQKTTLNNLLLDAIKIANDLADEEIKQNNLDETLEIMINDPKYEKMVAEADSELSSDAKFFKFNLNQADVHKSPESQYQVALSYLNGHGIDQDYNKGIEYLKRSANNNNNAAKHYLVSIYENGLFGQDIDFEQAYHWSKKLN